MKSSMWLQLGNGHGRFQEEEKRKKGKKGEGLKGGQR